jgi:hypothetical protein
VDSDLDVCVEETGGVSEHPAEQLKGDDHNDDPVLCLEKMGVSDPECVMMSSRSFTASAARNLIREPTDCPDLIINRSAQAVDEYDNPDLLPRMYPTLFPEGISGFEVRLEAYFFCSTGKLFADHSFRRHHSFMFVVLNIIQRCTAHLSFIAKSLTLIRSCCSLLIF